MVATAAAARTNYTLEVDLDHLSKPTPRFDIHYSVETHNMTDAQLEFNVTSETQPILLALAGEESLDSFYGEAGFIENLGAATGSRVIYAEHRYFGSSMPFNDTEAFAAPFNSWLTVEQALHDHIQLIEKVNANNTAPVIAVGGNYGGMLASFLRMRHPDLVHGAIASSAPLLDFANGTVADTAFLDKVTDQYNDQCWDKRCGLNIGGAFAADISPETFNEVMVPCTPAKSTADVWTAFETLQMGLSEFAALNFPYETDHLPSNPLKFACEKAYGDDVDNGKWKTDHIDHHTAQEFLTQMKVVYDVYSNETCLEWEHESSKQKALDVLGCGQIPKPIAASDHAMFNTTEWDAQAYTADCQSKYGMTPDYTWVWENFGGKSISDYANYTNIMFVNGELDPSRVAGVDCGLPDSACGQANFIGWQLPVYVIHGGANMYELRAVRHDDDPADAHYVRSQMRDLFNQWSADHLATPGLKRDIAWSPTADPAFVW